MSSVFTNKMPVYAGNHRTQKPSLVRGRNLVLQTILTVGNYEYVFAWIFMQNRNVEFETRATGILWTSLIDAGRHRNGATSSHQVSWVQLSCLRIDPMLDDHKNSVVQEDSIPVPYSEHENPHANAWRVVKTPFERSGYADADPFAYGCFKIVNEKVRNQISGNPVGYKLVPQPCQLILAGRDSVARRRARFAEHHIWVTRYKDGDLWAGEKWTNQSLEEIDGVHDYAVRNEDIRDQDIVLWHTFGMTHNPRVEDFPVMPVERTILSLKPADFFDKNPALDVP